MATKTTFLDVTATVDFSRQTVTINVDEIAAFESRPNGFSRISMKNGSVYNSVEKSHAELKELIQKAAEHR